MGLIGLRQPRLKNFQKKVQTTDSKYHVVEADFPPPDFLSEFPEDADYYSSLQRSKMEGFQFGYLMVHQGAVRLAVVPYFVTEFRLNTMLPKGFLKSLFSWAKLKIVCVGNPSSDIGRIHGVLNTEMYELVNRELQKKAAIVSYKGFGDDLPLADFIRARNLPSAVLKIVGDYWSTISKERLRNFQKKLKTAASVQFVESRHLTRDQAEKIYQLYLNTYDKAEVQFEKLSLEYFLEMGPTSNFLLCYDQGEIIGFVQLITKNAQMVFRYLGLDYVQSYKYGLYFALFIKTIEIALRDGVKEIDFGATSYEFKRRVGSEMVETYIYYYHRSPVIRWALSKLKFLLEPSESELR